MSLEFVSSIRIDSVLLLSSMVLTSWHHSSALAEESERSPVPLIFDTDIGNDVDDVLALAVIHALQTRGECELKAVTITKDHALAPRFADAVNTFYGRGDVPVGVCRSGVTTHEGRFNGLAAETKSEGFRYPHDLGVEENVPDAVEVLRQVLSQADDGTIVIAQVGFSSNLADLLKSPSDEISPLSGVELVKQKVRMLSIMAGAFEQIRNKQGELYDHIEYNVKKDLPAAQYLVKHWPTQVVWSGFEIGISVPYPHESILRDYEYVPHHPIKEAYIKYLPPPHNRPTWDLTSVLYAVYPKRNYFNLSEPGLVQIDEAGLTTHHPGASERDRYLILSDEQKVRVTEALVQLSSQPPKRQSLPR